jgi:hypothetical protein
MEIGRLSIDVQRASQGVWVEYEEGAAFLVASTATATYAAAQSARYEALWKMEGDKNAPWFREATREAELDLLCSHVLLGWRGLTDKGQPVEFSPAKARELLGRPGAFHVERFIRMAAARLDLYREQQVEEQGKG